MKNHELYKQIKAIAANYTIAQVELATRQQVCALLDIPVGQMSSAFFSNMKACLISELQEREDEADLQNVRAAASAFLDSNFPQWQADKGREGGKRFVKIWLDGRGE